MKRLFLMMLVAVLAMATVNAQTQERNGHRKGHLSPTQMIEKRIAMLDKELSLTPDQKTAIAAIYAEQAQQMKAEMEQMRANKDQQVQPKPEDMKARREAMKARQDEVDAKVAAQLTAEQKVKFEQIKANMGKRGPRHHKRGDGKAPEGKQDCCNDKMLQKDCCKDKPTVK